jgi:hypothetical protein
MFDMNRGHGYISKKHILPEAVSPGDSAIDLSRRNRMVTIEDLVVSELEFGRMN